MSTDSLEDARRMRDHAGASFPVLSDPGGAAAATPYGVFDTLGDGIAAPSTFIIVDGQIAAVHYGQSIGDRVPAAVILEFLRGGSGASATS